MAFLRAAGGVGSGHREDRQAVEPGPGDAARRPRRRRDLTGHHRGDEPVHGRLPRPGRRALAAALPRGLRERRLPALGPLEVRWGDQLEEVVELEPRDMVYVPPRETHILRNLSDSEPAEYVVARDSPTEDSVEVPWAGRPRRAASAEARLIAPRGEDPEARVAPLGHPRNPQRPAGAH